MPTFKKMSSENHQYLILLSNYRIIPRFIKQLATLWCKLGVVTVLSSFKDYLKVIPFKSSAVLTNQTKEPLFRRTVFTDHGSGLNHYYSDNFKIWHTNKN